MVFRRYLGGPGPPFPAEFGGPGGPGRNKKYIFLKASKSQPRIAFGAMDVTKPYKFIGFGAMDVTKPYKFVRFGAMLL